MEASDDTKLSKWRDEAKRFGADLYIGGYPQKTEWSRRKACCFGEGCATDLRHDMGGFGATDSKRIQSPPRQAATLNWTIHGKQRGKMPKDAISSGSVVFNGKQRQRIRRNQRKPEPAAKPEADDTRFNVESDETLIIQHNLSADNLFTLSRWAASQFRHWR